VSFYHFEGLTHFEEEKELLKEMKKEERDSKSY
jgi:hypothetical protein